MPVYLLKNTAVMLALMHEPRVEDENAFANYVRLPPACLMGYSTGLAQSSIDGTPS